MRVQRLSPTSAWVRKPSAFLSAFLKRSAACCLRSPSDRLAPCSPEHCGRPFSWVLGASASANELSKAPSANTDTPTATRLLIFFIRVQLLHPVRRRKTGAPYEKKKARKFDTGLSNSSATGNPQAEAAERGLTRGPRGSRVWKARVRGKESRTKFARGGMKD